MKPTIAQIIAAVAEAFQIRPDDITGPSRLAVHSHPRHAVSAIAHDAGYSFPQIGRRLGRDWSTVRESATRPKIISAKSEAFAQRYNDLRGRFVVTFQNYRDWKFKSIRSAQ